MEFVLLPVAIVLLFYFMLLKPQLDRQKRHRSNIADLEVGDEVLTAGGFFATVLDIETQDDGPPVIILGVAPGVELEATAAAIAEVNPRGRPEDEGADWADDADESPADVEADPPPDRRDRDQFESSRIEEAE